MSKKEDLPVEEEQNIDPSTTQQASEKAPEETVEEQIEKLTGDLEKALQDAEAHKDTAIRAKAEAENIRRRSEREVANASKFALERFAKEILAVVDSMEKALELPVDNESQQAMREGVELTYKLLVDTLAKFNIEQISPVGDAFDPALHEAMVMQESEEHDPNSVMHVIQTGYSLNGRLIRPARVIVAKGKSPEIDQKA